VVFKNLNVCIAATLGVFSAFFGILHLPSGINPVPLKIILNVGRVVSDRPGDSIVGDTLAEMSMVTQGLKRKAGFLTNFLFGD
jgi:hypothetical protein